MLDTIKLHRVDNFTLCTRRFVEFPPGDYFYHSQILQYFSVDFLLECSSLVRVLRIYQQCEWSEHRNSFWFSDHFSTILVMLKRELSYISGELPISIGHQL